MSLEEQSGAITRTGFDPAGGTRFYPRLRPQTESIPDHPPPIPPPLTPLSDPPLPTDPLSLYNIHYLGPLPRDPSTVPAPSLTPNLPTMASTTAPIPRGTVPRPRPMSLPPPTYTPSYSGTSSERPRQHAEQPHATAQRHSQRGVETPKPRTTNRILGDYTLSKTLGAGSMGKVKLAHHNITGEKVCLAVFLSFVTAPALQDRSYYLPRTPSLRFKLLSFPIILVVYYDRYPNVPQVGRLLSLPRTVHKFHSSYSHRGLDHCDIHPTTFFPPSFPTFVFLSYSANRVSSPS